MPKVKLSQKFTNEAVCEDGKNKTDYYDTATTGLILETRSSGKKTYYLRYRTEHNKLKQIKIAAAEDVSFDKAQKAAQKMKGRIALGEDPLAERQAKRTIPTLAEYSERYLDFAKGAKKSWETDLSFLRNHILPVWGNRHLDEIKPAEVAEYHQAMKAQGYALATCNRVVILLRYMFNLARRWSVPGAEQNPTRGVKLVEPHNGRERYLTAEETQRLYAALDQSENKHLKHIVTLLLLLGCRKGELLKSRWEEFDLGRKVWRIPMSKSGKPRYVPLGTAALELLEQIPRQATCPWLFANPRTGKPYNSFFHSWDAARKRAGLDDLRIHDVRHSFASFAVNSGVSIYEVSQLLGHSQLKMTQRYAHLSNETLLNAVDAAAAAWMSPVRNPERNPVTPPAIAAP